MILHKRHSISTWRHNQGYNGGNRESSGNKNDTAEFQEDIRKIVDKTKLPERLVYSRDQRLISTQ